VTDHDRRWAEIERRREAAEGPFRELCSGFLQLVPGRGAAGVRTLRRLSRALAALTEYRDAHNQARNLGGGELILGVRVVADELAAQIQEAAGPGQDPTTISWVLAGLRCPSQPFCAGCTTCFTVTAPTRPITGQVGVR
jgi:hypothetical protein